MKVMDWLFRREVLTDQEIDLIKVMEVKKEAGRNDVPSVVFEIREHGKHAAVGRCDLRMGMNEELYYAGQIGYTVYPMYRGHHYALKACRLLFQLAKQKYGIDSLIITCNPDNLPSRRTLEALGGELKAIVDVPKEHYLYQYGDVQKCIFEYHL